MKNTAKIITLFVVMCVIFGIFTACGGIAESTNDHKSNYNADLTAPDEYPQFEAITGIPEYPTPIEPDEPDEPAERIARYAASSESNKYHRLSCHYVDRIKSYNIVYYYTEDDALDDGKKPCSVCSP